MSGSFSDTLKTQRLDLPTSRFEINSYFATSFSYHKNWQRSRNNTISLNGSFTARHDKTTNVSEHHFLFKSDLSYTKFIDSIWQKETDTWMLSLQWNKKADNKFTRSWSLLANGQYLNTYSYVYGNDQRIHKKIVGDWSAPSSLEMGWGFNYAITQQSRINVTLATIKSSTRPRQADELVPENLFSFKRGYVVSDYGFGTQIFIKEYIGYSKLLWENVTTFFGNGISKDRIQFQTSNKLTMKVWKYMQIVFDTRIVYDPLFSYKLQFRQELIIGTYWGKTY